MTPKAYPMKFEIYDHTEHGRPDELVAVVTAQDEASASVEIKAGVNATEWAVLAVVIGGALTAMELQGEKQ